MAERILIVDDDPVQRRILDSAVRRLGFRSSVAEDGEQALSMLSHDAGDVDLLILDLVMPGLGGLEVLERLQAFDSRPPVIVQTAHGGIDTVVSAMRAGAADFVVKPISPERLEVSIRNALKVNALQGEIVRIQRKAEGRLTFRDLITRSPTMRRVIELGERAAASNIPIILEGESGVGKEVIARAIQGSSNRAGKPFVAVNCGAIPENLVESTLFGHERGAFTGATERRIGKFVEADGGTLFLDEVSELPPDAQVKLLRALQEGEVDPVGARKPVKTDFRLISATNRSMIEIVQQGAFREDLYYRLNVFPIMIPPLRERPEDIPSLVQHFATRFAAEEGKRIDGVSPRAIELLMRHRWPGNVRQLENAVFRAVVLADGPEVGIEAFPQIAAQVPDLEPDDIATAQLRETAQRMAVAGRRGWGAHQSPAQPQDLAGPRVGLLDEDGEMRPLSDVEADIIRFALEHYRGRMSEVARRLGIGRSTLYRRVRELGLDAAE
ncbi:sigma-54-dependent transcriptional regulator [Lutibaculum baratangense]|uniref:DNA-binding transcriptional regulator NtrC n=1 Tax=Lutibaculum baratangense AMV1 TaxID=631454 RepID=V4RIK2_9HYPH|nr:sigma-54 dependent transcriptional regulator [Lutibaculum baratangense]ESR23110.1 Response regulatory protein [Lutibaculum baratangense AMV1]